MYDEKHRITYYDLDSAGRLKMSAFLRMAHIAADVDAGRLGIGFREMSAMNVTFILNRFALGISRMPEYGETVRLRTWPDSVARGTFLRKGDMHDENGAKIMEWTSLWILFDITERKILKPTVLADVAPDLFSAVATGSDFGVESVRNRSEESGRPISNGDLCAQRMVNIMPERIILPDDGACAEFSRYTHTVRFSEVDTNMHMNNSVYGDLINNALGSAENWREVQLNYLAETRLDEEIDIAAHKDGDTFYVKGTAKDRASFAARVVVSRK
ncbi:MAG: thioesterase [Defluviitaleaceae bacterium]|nr:thioesterase [Defluviitaleaceae bacterium]